MIARHRETCQRADEGPEGSRWICYGEFDGDVEIRAADGAAALRLLERLLPPAGGAVRHAAPSVAESELHRSARRVSQQY